jgi:apolipoprotein N-acyltransferase
LHESFFMYPIVESIHVWGLALFLGFTALLDLRLLGVALRNMPVTQVVSRLRPWMFTGFAIRIVSDF